MIKSLNDEVVAVENTNTNTVDFNQLLPAGWYTAELVKVDDWKATKLTNVDVIDFDDKMQRRLDAGGNVIKTRVPEVTVYNARLTFSVNGKWVSYWVSTHPNIPWALPNLLHALGCPALKPAQLATLKGSSCDVYVAVKEYEATVKDDDGFESKVKRQGNEIKRVRATVAEVPEDFEEEAGLDLDL